MAAYSYAYHPMRDVESPNRTGLIIAAVLSVVLGLGVRGFVAAANAPDNSVPVVRWNGVGQFPGHVVSWGAGIKEEAMAEKAESRSRR